MKQCVRCKRGRLTARHVIEGHKGKEIWECDKEHKIDNPREITDCEDFEEKPSLKK